MISMFEALRQLEADAGARGDFLVDPEGWLATRVGGHLDVEDVHDSLILYQDNVDAPLGSVPPPPAPHPGENANELAVRYLEGYIRHDSATIAPPAAEMRYGDLDIDLPPVTAPSASPFHFDPTDAPPVGFGAGDAHDPWSDAGFPADVEPTYAPAAQGAQESAEPEHQAPHNDVQPDVQPDTQPVDPHDVPADHPFDHDAADHFTI